MTELQSKLLDMLKWFHSFCMQNSIRYYALGGTALGAIRHKGFIPWDDDIDVGLPREDYDKFIALMKQNPSDKYLLETPGEKKDFVYSYCKLYDTTTTLVENTRYNTKRGIYLDVFPLDGIGNTVEESYKNFKKINAKNNWISAKTCGIRKGRKWYKNLSIVCARLVPPLFGGWRACQKRVDKLCRSKAFDDYKYTVNANGAWREREIVERSVFGQPKTVAFEDAEICVQQDADAYLTKMYGDYMTPPPKEKQITHHDYIAMDLNKGYGEKL